MVRHTQLQSVPTPISDEEEIGKTVEENSISEEELIGGLRELQDAAEEYGDYYYSNQEDGLAMYVRENSEITLIEESSRKLVIFSEDRLFNDALTNTPNLRDNSELREAIYSHHERVTKDDLSEGNEDLASSTTGRLFIFNRSLNDEMMKPIYIGYDYSSETVFEANGRYFINGKHGGLRFDIEVTADIDGVVNFTARTFNHEQAQVDKSVTVEFTNSFTINCVPRGFQNVNSIRPNNPLDDFSYDDLSEKEKIALLRKYTFEALMMSINYWYKSTFSKTQCERCENPQEPGESRYMLNTDIVDNQSIIRKGVHEHVCTDCFAEFLNETTHLSQRQSKIYAYRELGFSHEKIKQEINKQISDPDDHITRGSISGSTSKIKDKISKSQSTVEYISEKAVKGVE